MLGRPARHSVSVLRLRARTFAIGSIVIAALVACRGRDDAGRRAVGVRDSDGVEHVAGYDEPLVVFHAGSLARPLRAALDSFTAHTAIPVVTVSAGSVEAAR